MATMTGAQWTGAPGLLSDTRGGLVVTRRLRCARHDCIAHGRQGCSVVKGNAGAAKAHTQSAHESCVGRETPVHTHQHDYTFYVLDGAPLDVFDANGESLGQFDAHAGAVFDFVVEGDELVSADDKALRVPATHKARNAGTSRYREMLVETKS